MIAFKEEIYFEKNHGGKDWREKGEDFSVR